MKSGLAPENIVVVQDIERLFHFLHKPLNNVAAVIISVPNEKELLALLEFRDLLLRIPIILILPIKKRIQLQKGIC